MSRYTNLSSPQAIYSWLRENVQECAASYPVSKIPQGIAIDIGANVGGFPAYAHSVFEKIYAFEPLEQHCDIMRGMLEELKIDNVEIIQKAVTGQSGDTVQLRAHHEYHSKDITCADFENEDFIDVNETCQTISLKDIFILVGADRISYLKIDCEGSEYEIFENFNEYDKIDLIAMEIHTFYGAERKRQLLEKLQWTHHMIGIAKASKEIVAGNLKPLDFGEESEVVKASHSLDELIEESNIFCVRHKWVAHAP
jgi:FkbM family methyltransferase